MVKIENVFSIGISVFNVQNLNDNELLKHCKEKYNNIKYKNFDGEILKQLKIVFLNEGENYIKKILGTDKSINLKIDKIWGNVYLDESISVPHNHRMSLVSAVYYLTEGNLAFLNPYQATLAHVCNQDIDKYNQYNSDIFYFDMIPGDMIIFNSHLQHYAFDKNKKNTDRISIACDMSMIRKDY